MTCVHCKGEVNKNNLFCPYCGENLISAVSDFYPDSEEYFKEPEKVFMHSGFFPRFNAYLIDGALLIVPTFVFSYYHFLLPTLITFLYFALFEASRLQGTPGKAMMRIKVVDEKLQRLTFLRSCTRQVWKALSFISIIGPFLCLRNKNEQSLHDILAKTFVVFSDPEDIIESFLSEPSIQIEDDIETQNVKAEPSSTQKPLSVGEISRMAKGKISSLPVVTAISDATLGASGIQNIQKELKSEPENPLIWLFYYEACINYYNLKFGIDTSRLIFNPVGFALSKSVATGLNAADDLYDKYDPESALNTALNLSERKVNEGTASSIELLVIGKALNYKAWNTFDKQERKKFLLESVKYLSLAIQMEENEQLISEYLFYLAKSYEGLKRDSLQLRSLNAAKALGFYPAYRQLSMFLLEKKPDHKIKLLEKSQFAYPEPILTHSVKNKVGESFSYMVSQQAERVRKITQS